MIWVARSFVVIGDLLVLLRLLFVGIVVDADESWCVVFPVDSQAGFLDRLVEFVLRRIGGDVDEIGVPGAVVSATEVFDLSGFLFAHGWLSLQDSITGCRGRN